MSSAEVWELDGALPPQPRPVSQPRLALGTTQAWGPGRPPGLQAPPMSEPLSCFCLGSRLSSDPEPLTASQVCGSLRKCWGRGVRQL